MAYLRDFWCILVEMHAQLLIRDHLGMLVWYVMKLYGRRP